MEDLSRSSAQGWPDAFELKPHFADGKDVMVTRAKSLMALILAVIWLPVTMHCGLEALPGFEFLVCCTHDEAIPHEDDDCEADACAVVESGFYKLQDHDDLVVASVEIEAELFQDRVTVFQAAVEPSGPPPDLAVGWQFSSRAAPPVRAPSWLL